VEFQPKSAQDKILQDVIFGVVITILIFVALVYLPVIGFFCIFLLPLPVLFYRSKLGRNRGILVPLLTVILIMSLLGKKPLYLFVDLLLIGFILSEVIELNLSVEKTILYSSFLALMIGSLFVFFYCSAFDTNLIDLISEYVDKNLSDMIKFYETSGFAEEQIYLLSKLFDSVKYYIIRTFPALAISGTLFLTWTSLLLARPIFNAKGIFYPDFGSLKIWKAPEHLVWGVIGCIIMFFLPGKSCGLIGLNGLIVLMTIYFFNGISIVAFFFEKKQFPGFLRFFIYTFIAIQQIVLLMVIVAGFVDTWVNFRKSNT